MKHNHDRIEALLNRALEFKPDERGAFLSGACGDDPELRQQVEALLNAGEAAQGFLADTPTLLGTAISEGPGTKIGRYKLLQQIGEGGMGVVYMAEQEEPVRRRVALKIIKLGMDTRQVVARFEAERQALAMMDHPNIARVLDGGTTESGRPYFVMELVQGVPIIEFCDKAKLPAQKRLELFIQVCQAVQSAHQKGVIHRDLKPSNILVTLHHGEPMPKVIDFGIAKATNQKLTEKTLFTNYATMIGTPAYMSPEQAEMTSMDVDTRTDIYSLGVLLYELLTGSTPFPEKRLRSMGYGEMQRVIADEEPERPSTRLSTLADEQKTVVAKNRGEDLAALNTLLRGDLDWIVMKCLEKDRTRRYDTANGLAADLKRHLDNEPVVARPPSAAYKFQKAWRRNKLVFAASGFVVVGLLIGLAALAFALVRERALKSESTRADAIATFATGMLNEAVPQLVQQGNFTGVRVLLESADRLVSTTLTNSPAAEFTVRFTLLNAYLGPLQNTQGASKQSDRIESLLSSVPDDRLPPGLWRDGLRVGFAMTRMLAGSVTQGYAELEKLAQELKQRGPAENRTHAMTLSALGASLILLNKPLEAEPLLAEARQMGPMVGDNGSLYSMALSLNGKYRLAEEVARTDVSRLNAKHGDSQDNLADYWQLVEILCRLGRIHEAGTLLEEQLGPGAARPWSPAQLRGFQMMQLAVQAYSGQWREAAPGLIAQATNSLAGVRDWRNGVAAALAAGHTNAHASLSRLARTRFAGNAEAESAHSLFLGLILRPQEEDLTLTLPDLLRRVEEGKDYHWSAVNILFLTSQLAYRKGAYEEALRSLDAWVESKDDRPNNAILLSFMRASALPDFWRAMILARLGRAEGASKAYGDGAQKLRAGFPRDWDFFDSLTTFYASQALRQEAREVLRSQGIAVPDTETTP